MSNIYDLHYKTFKGVSAYVIMKGFERVATIAFKRPSDGAGRLYAYVHWIGLPMVRGFASGGGYDKATAACVAAINQRAFIVGHNTAISKKRLTDEDNNDIHAFRAALAKDEGPYWDDALRTAGFAVFRAV